MPLDQDVAGLFCIGFHGTTPTLEVLDLIRRGVHGVVLFARNVVEAEQVAQLVGDLKRAANGRPLLVSIDQEGGRVARLRASHGFTEVPPMRALGQSGDAALAREVGALLGRELRAVGIDQDYAPCVDVDTNPQSSAIAPSRASRRRSAGSGRRSRRASSRRASPPARSTSPATATRARTRTRTCRGSRTRWSGCAGWSSRRSPPSPAPAWPR
jgi:hypothetical protein